MFRRYLLDKHGWKCSLCRRRGRLEIHHHIPLHKGGPVYDEANCRVVCVDCHLKEHGKAFPGRKEFKDLVKRLVPQ